MDSESPAFRMTTPTENILGSLKDGFIGLKDGIINFINNIINGIAPNYKIQFVFLISLIIGIIITRWQNPKKKYLYGTVVTFLIFMSLRFIGIGN